MSLLEVEEEQYTPRSFDEYVGQAELKRRLLVYLDAAMAQDEPMAHVLLASPPGYGKTTLATLICKYLNDPLFVVDIAAMSDQQWLSFFRRFPGGVLFFDEAHRASKKQLTGLLTLLEDGYIASPSGYPIEPPWFSAIFATTEADKLPEPLIERCQFRPQFVEYTDDEATQIVRQGGQSVKLDIPEDIAKGLGRAAAGCPRQAVRLVKAYRALSFKSTPTLEAVLDLCEVDQDGLSDIHYQYLRALDKMDGIAGENPLMRVLRLNSTTALANIEIPLVKRNMITYTPKGRALLPAGDLAISGLRKQEWRGRRR